MKLIFARVFTIFRPHSFREWPVLSGIRPRALSRTIDDRAPGNWSAYLIIDSLVSAAQWGY